MQLNNKQHKLGLALSGGGAKGFAHLGVFKALEEKGIRPDIISGTSAGALAGALYADGNTPENILSFFEKKAFKEFAELAIPKSGIFKANKLKQFLKDHLKAKNIEDLNIPLKIVATDIENGTSVVFDKGPLVPAILASCAFPIIFSPIKIGQIHYLDGGLFKNFPVSTIRNECDIIIGVNVTPLTKQQYKNSLLYIAERSFHYASVANAIPDRKLCDILIEPIEIAKYPMFSLDHSSNLFDIGYKDTISSFSGEKNINLWNKLVNI